MERLKARVQLPDRTYEVWHDAENELYRVELNHKEIGQARTVPLALQFVAGWEVDHAA